MRLETQRKQQDTHWHPLHHQKSVQLASAWCHRKSQQRSTSWSHSQYTQNQCAQTYRPCSKQIDNNLVSSWWSWKTNNRTRSTRICGRGNLICSLNCQSELLGCRCWRLSARIIYSCRLWTPHIRMMKIQSNIASVSKALQYIEMILLPGCMLKYVWILVN